MAPDISMPETRFEFHVEQAAAPPGDAITSSP